jgi:DNA-binding MarR family transcriptional regulator
MAITTTPEDRLNATVPASSKTPDLLIFQLAALSIAATRALSSVHENLDLKMAEWLVITTLGESDELTARDLCTKHRLHKTTMSRTVHSLLERKLITRRQSMEDSRQSPLSLTAQGRSLYEKCASSALEIEACLEQAIAPADREAWNRCLENLIMASTRLATR